MGSPKKQDIDMHGQLQNNGVLVNPQVNIYNNHNSIQITNNGELIEMIGNKKT